MRKTNTGTVGGRATSRRRRVAGRAGGSDPQDTGSAAARSSDETQPAENTGDSGSAGRESPGKPRNSARIRRAAATAVRPVSTLRRPRMLVPVVLVAGLLAMTGYLGMQLHQQQLEEQARTSALESARRYAEDLSTYDHENLEQNFAAVKDNAHGQFAEQYEQVGSSLSQLIQQNRASSEGTVLSAGNVRTEQDRAVVALFVDQKITNKNNPEPRIDRNRMRMTLVLGDGGWLIDGVKLL